MLNLAIAKYMPREGLLAVLPVCPVLGWVWVGEFSVPLYGNDVRAGG